MQLVLGMPWNEAVNKIGRKSNIGSKLSSAEWADVPVALRERAFFSSQVESIHFLQRARNGIADFLRSSREVLPNGDTVLKTGSRAAFVDQMQTFLAAEGVERTTGGLGDITSERRLGLIFDIQVRQAEGYGAWREGMDPDVLSAFPAQRFIREEDVKEPRNSHAQYENGVWLKTDPIWANEINEDFGVGWPPFAFGCRHTVEDVSREEAEALGLLEPGQPVVADERSFNDNLQASVGGLDPDLLEKLKSEFGNQITIEGDAIIWTEGRA